MSALTRSTTATDRNNWTNKLTASLLASLAEFPPITKAVALAHALEIGPADWHQTSARSMAQVYGFSRSGFTAATAELADAGLIRLQATGPPEQKLPARVSLTEQWATQAKITPSPCITSDPMTATQTTWTATQTTYDRYADQTGPPGRPVSPSIIEIEKNRDRARLVPSAAVNGDGPSNGAQRCVRCDSADLLRAPTGQLNLFCRNCYNSLKVGKSKQEISAMLKAANDLHQSTAKGLLMTAWDSKSSNRISKNVDEAGRKLGQPGKIVSPKRSRLVPEWHWTDDPKYNTTPADAPKTEADEKAISEIQAQIKRRIEGHQESSSHPVSDAAADNEHGNQELADLLPNLIKAI